MRHGAWRCLKVYITASLCIIPKIELWIWNVFWISLSLCSSLVISNYIQRRGLSLSRQGRVVLQTACRPAVLHHPGHWTLSDVCSTMHTDWREEEERSGVTELSTETRHSRHNISNSVYSPGQIGLSFKYKHNSMVGLSRRRKEDIDHKKTDKSTPQWNRNKDSFDSLKIFKTI